MIIFGIFIVLVVAFLIMTVIVNKQPQDPMARKWSNRTDEGSRDINEMIADGWDYTHDMDGRFAYFTKKGDGWEVSILADEVFIYQEGEGSLEFEFPWCDDESTRKFAELAILGMTDHDKTKPNREEKSVSESENQEVQEE